MRILDNGVERDATPAEVSDIQSLAATRDTNYANYSVSKQKIKSFYDSCVNGTATIAQMRTAWVQLIEYIYAREISN